jgi:hypothetical protein
MSYEDFERKSQEIRAENAVLLDGFRKWLSEGGLKEKTIEHHIQNVDFYINHYLLYDDCTKAVDGVSSLNGFFNWFFPRKAMWSSKTTAKETAASLKKFYTFLAELKLLSQEDYRFLLLEVKNEMSEWLSNYSDEHLW